MARLQKVGEYLRFENALPARLSEFATLVVSRQWTQQLVGARKLTVGDARHPVALMTAGFGCGQMIGPSFAGITCDQSGSFLLPSMCAAGSLVLASVLALRAGQTRG